MGRQKEYQTDMLHEKDERTNQRKAYDQASRQNAVQSNIKKKTRQVTY
jgi:hypothetical protein